MLDAPAMRDRRREGCEGRMKPEEVLDELKTILVERLKFDPHRAAETTLATTLPKGVEGSLGLDSLDFIELSIAIEERFGVVIDEREDLAPHFESFDTLTRYLGARMARE
jgi:acyl carrier protein